MSAQQIGGNGKVKGRKHLMVTGDDFGKNSAVNEAIERYHQEGLLTQASLMVNEAAVDEALRIAQRNPGLTVGLHLTLCCGKAARPSPLTDSVMSLPNSPAVAGLRYAFDPRLHAALTEEIAAQFAAFAGLGLPPVYWDGHTHLHLHPTVLALTLPIAAAHGFRATRLVREPGWGALQVVFRALSLAARPALDAHGIAYAQAVYGLEFTGQFTTHESETVVARLRDGWSELYFHPGAEPAELDCQLLKALLELEGVALSSARDLTQNLH